MHRRSAALPLLILITACSTASSRSDTVRSGLDPERLALTEVESACALSENDARWIQRALDGWERVHRDFLEIDPSPLPWLVLFNRSCAWHLAPEESRLSGTRPARLILNR